VTDGLNERRADGRKRVLILTWSLPLEEGVKGMSSQNQELTRLTRLRLSSGRAVVGAFTGVVETKD